jgi:YbbR domain-containing protein
LTAANLLPIFSSQVKDLNINYIAADTIFFKIEPFKERKLSIKLDSSNIHLKENFYITSNLFMEPDSVIFRGPLSLVDRLPDVFKVTLSDKNINSRFDEELSLDLFSSSMIKKTPEVIHIKFEVEEYIDQTAKLSIEQVNFPYDSTAFILNSTVDVTFKLQRSFRNKMKTNDFLLFADLNNMHAADSTITIEVMDQPDYIMDLSLKETRVKVFHEK